MMEVILITALVFVSVLHFMNDLFEAFVAAVIVLFLGCVAARAEAPPPVAPPKPDVSVLYPRCLEAWSACDQAAEKLKDQVVVLKDSARQWQKKAEGGPNETPVLLLSVVAGALGGGIGGYVAEQQAGTAKGGIVGAAVGLVVGLIAGGGK